MTQPALTKIVSRVEHLVGVALFDRGRRGGSLTPFGELFLNRMGTVERELLNLANEVDSMKSGLSGTVSIGVGQFWLSQIVPNMIARLAQDVPEIRVKITTGARTGMLARLQKGEIDCLLGRITDGLHRLKADWFGWTRSAGVIRVKDRPLLPCCEKLLSLLRQEMRATVRRSVMPGDD